MRIAVLIPLLLVPAVALTQSTATIAGRTVDEAGQPVAGVRVGLQPGERQVVSDENGDFEFRDVAVGQRTLSARRIGYRASATTIALTTSGAKATIVLVAIPALLDSIRIRERANSMRYGATVLDDAGTPIADVAVVVAGIENTIRTDATGHFTIAKDVHGVLMIRMRKIGYAAYLGSVRMLAEREDTLRMARLAQGLTAVQINEASGFGRDTFVYRDLDQRMRWRDHKSTVITREDLARFGKESLCPVVACSPACVIIDGNAHTLMPPDAFYADRVEAIEIYPAGSDWSGNLAARGCRGRGRTLVIWQRKDSTIEKKK